MDDAMKQTIEQVLSALNMQSRLGIILSACICTFVARALYFERARKENLLLLVAPAFAMLFTVTAWRAGWLTGNPAGIFLDGVVNGLATIVANQAWRKLGGRKLFELGADKLARRRKVAPRPSDKIPLFLLLPLSALFASMGCAALAPGPVGVRWEYADAQGEFVQAQEDSARACGKRPMGDADCAAFKFFMGEARYEGAEAAEAVRRVEAALAELAAARDAKDAPREEAAKADLARKVRIARAYVDSFEQLAAEAARFAEELGR